MELAVLAASASAASDSTSASAASDSTSASAASDSTSALSYFYTSGRRRPSVLACSSSRRPDHTALTSFYTPAASAASAAAAAADVSNSPPLSGFFMKNKAIKADYQTPGSIAVLKHKNISGFTQEHVTIKLDPIPSFDGVAFVKKLFARINGTPANDTSIMLKAETIVNFGLVVAVMVLHTGFSVKSLTKHVKTQLPKEFYDSVKEIVTNCLVIIISNLKNLISTANKPSILKVFMDGSPVGRTIDLKTCNDYKSLSTIVQVLYPGLGMCRNSYCISQCQRGCGGGGGDLPFAFGSPAHRAVGTTRELLAKLTNLCLQYKLISILKLNSRSYNSTTIEQ